MILLGATEEVQAMLQQLPNDHYSHHVMMGGQNGGTMLFAARMNNCSQIENHVIQSTLDGYLKCHKDVRRVAFSNIMVCTFKLKQRVWHLGYTITVMGVHGHHTTMNRKLSES